MPIAILEAMASGLPVVATDVGGISEGVLHGQNGFLVRSAPITPDFVDAICPLLADPALRQRIGQAASKLCAAGVYAGIAKPTGKNNYGKRDCQAEKSSQIAQTERIGTIGRQYLAKAQGRQRDNPHSSAR